MVPEPDRGHCDVPSTVQQPSQRPQLSGLLPGSARCVGTMRRAIGQCEPGPLRAASAVHLVGRRMPHGVPRNNAEGRLPCSPLLHVRTGPGGHGYVPYAVRNGYSTAVRNRRLLQLHTADPRQRVRSSLQPTQRHLVPIELVRAHGFLDHPALCMHDAVRQLQRQRDRVPPAPAVLLRASRSMRRQLQCALHGFHLQSPDDVRHVHKHMAYLYGVLQHRNNA